MSLVDYAPVGSKYPHSCRAAPDVTLNKEKSYIKEIETDYDLILHDDVFHTVDEVKDIIAKVRYVVHAAACRRVLTPYPMQVVPLCPPPANIAVTWKTHRHGAATVCTSNKKMIDEVTSCCVFSFV